MLEFRQHAYQTNDIFLVAAQAMANTLIRATDALTAGSHLPSQSGRACAVLGHVDACHSCDLQLQPW